MYCGTDKHGWDMFWAKRKDKSLTARQLRPFYDNLACMMGIVEQCGNAITLADPVCSKRFIRKSVLEVGAGRGTMSNLFFQKGFDVFCTDIEHRLADHFVCQKHVFVKNDILESRPFAKEQFDIVFSYGLAEHFDYVDRFIIMERCLDAVKPGGLSMHYVVPKKWTNVREDRSVCRYGCKDLMCGDHTLSKMGSIGKSGIKYVYPVLSGRDWECSKFWSKGFIIWVQKANIIDAWVDRHVVPTLEADLIEKEKHNDI